MLAILLMAADDNSKHAGVNHVVAAGYYRGLTYQKEQDSGVCDSISIRKSRKEPRRSSQQPLNLSHFFSLLCMSTFSTTNSTTRSPSYTILCEL